MKVLTLMFTALLVIGMVIAAEAEVTSRKAEVTEVEGTAEVKQLPVDSWSPAEVGMNLAEGDSVKTRSKSMMTLFLEGESETASVEVKENTEMRLVELFEDREKGTQTTMLDLAIGDILISSKKLRAEGSRFEVKTPTSIVGVRGTVFSVSVKLEE